MTIHPEILCRTESPGRQQNRVSRQTAEPRTPPAGHQKTPGLVLAPGYVSRGMLPLPMTTTLLPVQAGPPSTSCAVATESRSMPGMPPGITGSAPVEATKRLGFSLSMSSAVSSISISEHH